MRISVASIPSEMTSSSEMYESRWRFADRPSGVVCRIGVADASIRSAGRMLSMASKSSVVPAAVMPQWDSSITTIKGISASAVTRSASKMLRCSPSRVRRFFRAPVSRSVWVRDSQLATRIVPGRIDALPASQVSVKRSTTIELPKRWFRSAPAV